MQGTILDFAVQANEGIITGADGRRYAFPGAEWKSSQAPRQGLIVDFEVRNEQAVGIYTQLATAHGEHPKNRTTAAILAFLLGTFGAHKFYLGLTKEAIIMLLVSLGGLILLMIPTLVMGVIGCIEFVIYLTKSDDEFQRLYILEKKGWF